MTIRIVVADDHEMVRLGLGAVLARHDDLAVVASVASGPEAIDAASATDADVVLMDLSMPGMSGIEAAAEMTRRSIPAAVVIVSTFDEPSDVAAAIDAGARGYVVKSVGPDELASCIRTVAAGGTSLSAPVAARLISEPFEAPAQIRLTVRERQVLELILDGCSNRQIANALAISEKTVKTHCGHLFQRLGVRDRTQAAVWAERHLRHSRPRV